MPELRIGCSGWTYRSWRARFYPRDLPSSEWLRYYASTFDSVEANGTFYRLPETDTFGAWRKQTPRGFLMSVKASRYLTHMKRLQDPSEPVARLLRRASALGPKLGPILYQLPPNLQLDAPRLEAFLGLLPRRWTRGGRRLRHVVEFRHPTWYVTEIFEMLERSRVALCLHDRSGSAIESPAVGPCVYVRFHGASGAYHGRYADDHLDRWADRLASCWKDGRDVFAYFNNDPDAVATENARTLQQLVRRRLSRAHARARAARPRRTRPGGRARAAARAGTRSL